MLYGFVLFIILFVLIHPLADNLASKYRPVRASILKALFYFHFLMWIVYYVYALNNPSDSVKYFDFVADSDEGWFSFYGISTKFIYFAGYPWIKFFGFTYEACMVFFAFLGYLGIIFLYIFFKENLKFLHSIIGIDIVVLIFFLPNIHFWTVSLGKGSIIFLGIGLFFFGISKPLKRVVALGLGMLIIYHVRSHILLVILIATFVGFVSGSGRVPIWQKSILVILATVVFFNIYQQVLISTGLETDFFEEATVLSKRAFELSKEATSGIPIQEYSVPVQLFTFWFRPLFYDAPGILGMIVSIENLVLLIVIFSLIGWGFFPFLFKSDPIVKTSILTFLLASYPLAQISGNLGIALRQKSMVMLLLFFALLVYQDRKKLIAYKNHLVNKKRKEARLRSLHLETK